MYHNTYILKKLSSHNYINRIVYYCLSMNNVQNKHVKKKIIRKTRYTEIMCRYDEYIDDDDWDNDYYKFQEYNDKDDKDNEDDYQDDCASVYAECGERVIMYHRSTNAFD